MSCPEPCRDAQVECGEREGKLRSQGDGPFPETAFPYQLSLQKQDNAIYDRLLFRLEQQHVKKTAFLLVHHRQLLVGPLAGDPPTYDATIKALLTGSYWLIGFAGSDDGKVATAKGATTGPYKSLLRYNHQEHTEIQARKSFAIGLEKCSSWRSIVCARLPVPASTSWCVTEKGGVR